MVSLTRHNYQYLYHLSKEAATNIILKYMTWSLKTVTEVLMVTRNCQ